MPDKIGIRSATSAIDRVSVPQDRACITLAQFPSAIFIARRERHSPFQRGPVESVLDCAIEIRYVPHNAGIGRPRLRGRIPLSVRGPEHGNHEEHTTKPVSGIRIALW